MPLSLHSLVFPDPRDVLDPDTLQRVRDLGYDGIEVVPIDYDADDYDELRAGAERAGLRTLVGWSLSPEHNVIDDDPARRDAGIAFMKSLVDGARRLGAPIVAGVNFAGCGCLTGKPPTAVEHARAVAAYQVVCDHAAPDVTVCLEPATRHDSHLINTVAQATRFLDAVARPNAGLLLDTHQMLREENDFYGAITEAGPYIRHFHVSESHRGIPGTGTVNWREVARALGDLRYEGWVGIEAFFDPDACVASRAHVWRRLAASPLDLARQARLHYQSMLDSGQ